MDKVKLIIRDELKKESENYLIESFEPLSKIEDEDILTEKVLKTTLKLVSEGYTFDEISVVLEQKSSAWGNFWGNLVDPETGKFNIMNLFKQGGKSMLWEQIIKWVFLNVLGTSQTVAQSAGTFLSEYNPLHLLRLFKGYQPCVQEIAHTEKGGGGLGATLVEIFINNSQFEGKEQNIFGAGGIKVGIRNVAAEAVRESNLDDILAEKICGLIWKRGETTQKPPETEQPNQNTGNPPPKATQ